MIVIYLNSINHKTAPIEIRERISLNLNSFSNANFYPKKIAKDDELFIISTCNRTEFYAVSKHPKYFENIKNHLKQKGVEEKYTYEATNEHAIQHIFRTICGVESMAFGETQITNQFKKFYTHQKNKQLHKYLHRLIQMALQVSKMVRLQTNISKQKTSIASIAVQNARTHEKKIKDKNILIIGSGENTQELIIQLKKINLTRIYITNRSNQKAKQIALKHHFSFVSWQQKNKIIQTADIIFSSITSPQYIIHPDILDAHKKQLIFDLGIPRNVSPIVAQNTKKILMNIDQLELISIRNQSKRKQDLQKAERIIEQQIKRYQDWCSQQHLIPSLIEMQEQRKKLEIEAFKELNQTFQLSDLEQQKIQKILQKLYKKSQHHAIQALQKIHYNEPQKKPTLIPNCIKI